METKPDTIAFRVPRQLADRLRADAEEMETTTSDILRKMLKKRYSAPGDARNSNATTRKTDGAEGEELFDA